MLVLERRRGEKIVLLVGGKRITVSIESPMHARVRVGVDAPWDVGIWRDEFLSELSDSPAHIYCRQREGMTMCGRKVGEAGHTVSEATADNLFGYVCRKCEGAVLAREDMRSEDFDDHDDDEIGGE